MSDPKETPKEDPLNALRQLLFSEENVRIEAIEERFEDDKILAHDVASVLVEAINIRTREGKQLGAALTPTIEEAIQTSIATNPEPLSNSLFPIMGPAIRKSINNAIEEMLQSLTQTLDNSFSIQGMRWRWDAFRTGKSFSEVVLLNTLIYRVEQAFLIHKETGVLLHHLSFDPVLHADADVISSMLTAVRDFAQESFSSSGNQQIQDLSMGDLEIKIESSSNLVLALVCRGKPPRSLRTSMQEVVTSIQHSFFNELRDFQGETSVFDHAKRNLEPLMVSDFEGTNGSSSPIKAIATLAGIFLGLAGWWGWSVYQSNASSTNWDNYVAHLELEPGIIISNATKNGELMVLNGLRDPLSTDPKPSAEKFNLDPKKITYSFEPYYALAHDIVLKRITNTIEAPDTIELDLIASTLYLSGKASSSWLSEAQKYALFIPGVSRVDSSNVNIPKPTKIVEPIAHIEKPKPIAKPKTPVIQKAPPEPELPLSDAEILRREIALLKPPSTVHMTYGKGILHVSGAATQKWVDFADHNYMKVRGVTSLYTRNFTIIEQE